MYIRILNCYIFTTGKTSDDSKNARWQRQAGIQETPGQAGPAA
jgi:hypothetical protein